MVRVEDGSAYSAIYQVLDDLRSSHSVPVGACGKVYSAIDRLKVCQAPAEHVTVAENVSIFLQRWQWARQKHDNAAEAKALERLAELNAAWLAVPLPDLAKRIPALANSTARPD